MSSEQSPDTKRLGRLRRTLQNIKDSYTISRRTYPWVGWVMVGSALAIILLAVGISVLLSQPLWYWVALAVVLAATVAIAILSWAVPRAAYTQMESTPGSAKMALDQIGRGWYVESDPVAIAPSTWDTVWRVVGSPGVVLVAQGPLSRTQQMVAEERRRVRRVLTTVPVHVIHVGPGKGQVPLSQLRQAIRQLPTRPTKLTSNEISQVSKRLSSLSKGPAVPKGVDPSKVRIDRRALRGR